MQLHLDPAYLDFSSLTTTLNFEGLAKLLFVIGKSSLSIKFFGMYYSLYLTRASRTNHGRSPISSQNFHKLF